MTATVSLPLPPEYGQPNKLPASRRGRIILGRQKREYRAKVGLAVRNLVGDAFHEATKVRVSVTLYHKGRLDEDNVPHWCKVLLDAVQDGIGVNDRYFIPTYEQRRERANPRAVVVIERAA